MHPGVFLSLSASLFHRPAVIAIVLNYLGSSGTEEILFPLLRIRRHVDKNLKSQSSPHNAYAEPEISRGTHRQSVLRKEGTGLGLPQKSVRIFPREKPLPKGQILRMLEHLVDPPPGLDGSRNGEMAIHLELSLIHISEPTRPY